MAVAGNSIGSAGIAGVSIDGFGKVTFDQSKFKMVYETNPAAVQSLFSQSTQTTGNVSFVSAGDPTTPAPTTSWSQLGRHRSDRHGPGRRLAARRPLPGRGSAVGDTTALYDILPTDSQADAVAGLQARIDAAGEPVGRDRRWRHPDHLGQHWGGAGFEVAWDGTTFESFNGSDVSGTIGGWPPPAEARPCRSARRRDRGRPVRHGPAGASGNVGTVVVPPGIAQRIASAVDRRSTPRTAT